MSVVNIRPGIVCLVEVMSTKYRPAVVVNNYGNHSVIIPLRKVTSEDIQCGIPAGQVTVQFEGNIDQYSVAQCDCIKSVPNLKIVKELGMLYPCDVRTLNRQLQFGGNTYDC